MSHTLEESCADCHEISKTDPTADWISRQIVEAFPWETARPI